MIIVNPILASTVVDSNINLSNFNKDIKNHISKDKLDESLSQIKKLQETFKNNNKSTKLKKSLKNKNTKNNDFTIDKLLQTLCTMRKDLNITSKETITNIMKFNMTETEDLELINRIVNEISNPTTSGATIKNRKGATLLSIFINKIYQNLQTYIIRELQKIKELQKTILNKEELKKEKPDLEKTNQALENRSHVVNSIIRNGSNGPIKPPHPQKNTKNSFNHRRMLNSFNHRRMLNDYINNFSI